MASVAISTTSKRLVTGAKFTGKNAICIVQQVVVSVLLPDSEAVTAQVCTVPRPRESKLWVRIRAEGLVSDDQIGEGPHPPVSWDLVDVREGVTLVLNALDAPPACKDESRDPEGDPEAAAERKGHPYQYFFLIAHLCFFCKSY